MKLCIIDVELTDGMVLMVKEFQKYLNDHVYNPSRYHSKKYTFEDALFLACNHNLYSKLISSMESLGAFDLVHESDGDNDES